MCQARKSLSELKDVMAVCWLNTRDYMRESLLLLIFILHVLIIRRQNKWMPWRSSEWRKGVYWSHRSYEYHYSKSPPGLLNQSRGGGPDGDQREPVKVSSHSFYPAPPAMLVMWDLDQILTQRRSGPDLDQVQHTGWYLPVDASSSSNQNGRGMDGRYWEKMINQKMIKRDCILCRCSAVGLYPYPESK